MASGRKSVNLLSISVKQTQMSALWLWAAASTMFTGMKGTWTGWRRQSSWSVIQRRHSITRKPCAHLSVRMRHWVPGRYWIPMWPDGRSNYSSAGARTALRLRDTKYVLHKASADSWMLMSLAHFIYCTETGRVCPFEDGYTFFLYKIQEKHIEYLYQCGVRCISLEKVLALVA